MAEVPSRFEMEGRAHYAQVLARWLVRNGFDAATVSAWSEGQWLTAARAAGIRSAIERRKVPSERTRGMVVGLLTPSPVHESFYAGRHTRGSEEATEEG